MFIRAGVIGLSAVTIAASAGCTTVTDCAGIGRPDFIVTVVDSLTNAPAAAGATLLTYDLAAGGVRVDSVTAQNDSDLLIGAIDRSGRFSVAVRKVGYRDWTKVDVTVQAACSVQTVMLTARLARP